MPNHCYNQVSISGPDEVVKDLEAFVQGKGPRYADPDPYDWGNGRRTGVPIEAAEIDDSQELDLFCFHKIIPVPLEILKKGYSDAGYTWQADHWGTKWGAYDLSIHSDLGLLRLSFDTAWSPAVPIIEKLAEMFPALEIEHHFDEPGMCFQGTHTYMEGELVNEMWLEGDEYPGDEEDEEESLGANKIGDFPRAE